MDDDDGDNDGKGSGDDDSSWQTKTLVLFPSFRLNGISHDWTSCYAFDISRKSYIIIIISAFADLVDQSMLYEEEKNVGSIILLIFEYLILIFPEHNLFMH